MGMDSLIQTINKLQDVFAVVNQHQPKETKIDLPQIVVVGSQSSGKSSVLESLVHKSFLPRGVGIVTRVLLVIQIIRYDTEMYKSMLKITNDDSITEWACFSEIPETVFHNFDEVRQKIEEITDKYAGNNKGIVNKPIVLKVFTLLYNLTLVDLPGITKIPLGDQPKDIDQQINSMILEYVTQPNSIILAVVTANTDPSTSEGLQIAKKVDPNGERTIAVVTKLDLIDQGTLDETKQFLCGNRIPVKLGIIGVVNRSQKAINNNQSMEQTLRTETEFLKKYYPDIYKKHGNVVLADTLQNILLGHIEKTYSGLLGTLKDVKIKCEDRLKSLFIPENKNVFIMGLIKDISRAYCDTIKGNHKNVSDKIVMGGARIVQILNKEYTNNLNNIDGLHSLNDTQIQLILLNTAGTNNSSFVNEKALEIMIGRQLEYLLKPSILVVDSVCEEMYKMFNFIDQNILDTLKRYPKMYTDVKNVLWKLLNIKVANIKDFIKSYIETHQSCLNMTNPDFTLKVVNSSTEIRKAYINTHLQYIKNNVSSDKTSLVAWNSSEKAEESFIMQEETAKRQALEQMLCSMNNLNPSRESSRQVNMHKILTRSYFCCIRDSVKDFVPKYIQHKMVNFILDTFENQLVKEVALPYYAKSIEEVFIEEKGVPEERKQTLATLTAVDNALKIMEDVKHN